jgi:iron complex outermembrane receptor protein
MSFNLKVLASAVSVIAISSSFAANAQSAPVTSPPAEAQNPEQSGLTEIIVTAQKRAENLQDVPVAVSVLTGEQLAASGGMKATDLTNLVPNLDLRSTNAGIQVAVRGIGSFTPGAGQENSVALYIDGVYIATPAAGLLTLSDVAQVEVLKGPQGTLFGRNATGGLLQVTTRNPTQELTAEAQFSYANYDTKTFSGYVSGGLSDNLSAGVSLYVSGQGDGYGKNQVTGRDVNRLNLDLATRGTLVYEPGPATTIRLSLDYQNRHGSSYVTGTQPRGSVNLVGISYQGSLWGTASPFEPYMNYEAGGASLRVEHDFDFGTITSTTAYRKESNLVRFVAVNTPTPLFEPNLQGDSDQFTQELQIASRKGSSIQWVAGLFYIDASGKADPYNIAFGGALVSPFFPVTLLSSVADQGTESVAGYAQATFPLFDDDTHLTVGGRYTWEKRTFVASQTATLLGGVVVPTAAANTSKSYERPTWRVALDRKLGRDTLIYASYNRGFKSGGFNVQVPTDPAFAPERLDAYEVGLKTEVFDRNLRFNVAGFLYNYKNIQVNRFTPVGTSFYNGASAKLYGVDLDIVGRINDELTLTGGMSYLHDRFTSFPNADFIIPLPGGGGAPTTGSAKGNRLAYAPDFTFTLGAHYDKKFDAGSLKLDVNYYWNDGFFVTVDNLYRQPTYGNLGGSIGWETDRWGVSVWGRNLTNTAVVAGSGVSVFATAFNYQAPRTYGVTFKVKY